MAALGADGHPAKGEGFMPPVPLPRRMWAGGTSSHARTPARRRHGHAAARSSLISTVKEGRTGLLCFRRLDHQYSTPRGVACVTERQTSSIASDPKPAAKSAAAGRNGAPRAGRWSRPWQVEATPILLFRYSALTFNGHRIHYDHPYATGVEGYPGPRRARSVAGHVLMFNLAAGAAGTVPAELSATVGCRRSSPGSASASSGARRELGRRRVRCWTENSAGQICMEAEAT